MQSGDGKVFGFEAGAEGALDELNNSMLVKMDLCMDRFGEGA